MTDRSFERSHGQVKHARWVNNLEFNPLCNKRRYRQHRFFYYLLSMGKSLISFNKWDTVVRNKHFCYSSTTFTIFYTSSRGKWLQLGWLAWQVGSHPQRWASSPSSSSSSSALTSWPFASAVKGEFIQTPWSFTAEWLLPFNTFVGRWFCDNRLAGFKPYHRWYDQQSRDSSDLMGNVWLRAFPVSRIHTINLGSRQTGQL